MRHLLLFAFFRFPKWHIFATSENRKYKNKVSSVAVAVAVDFYCEIGCGLGEIIGSLSNTGSNLFGVDIDKRVLKGARSLKSNVDFINLDIFENDECEDLFTKIERSSPTSGMFILVNWANSNQIEKFVELARSFHWRNLKSLQLVFDVRSSEVQDLESFAYIPSRSLLTRLNGKEIDTGDYERNIC